jgi:hypothetical protein
MSVGNATAQHTDYSKLMTEYRECVNECRASLDRLHSMERRLRKIAITLPIQQRLGSGINRNGDRESGWECGPYSRKPLQSGSGGF